MKVIKIDIKKEYLDVRDNNPYLYIAEYPNMIVPISSEAYLTAPQSVTSDVKKYILKTIILNGVQEKCFIKDSDDRLIDDLLYYNSRQLEQVKAEERVDEMFRTEDRMKRKFKSLKWYQRLFYK